MATDDDTTTTTTARRRARVRAPMLLAHTAQVALTPLIPVPFLDDAVKAYLERRLTAQLARAHGLALPDEAVRAIADGPSESILAKLATGVVLLPLKMIFRKIFFVLEVKRVSDLASESYHRGYLLDLALASGALAPRGPRSPAEVRAAIDAVLADGAVSPVGAAMRGAFEGSRDLLVRTARELGARALRLIGRGPVSEAAVASAVEEPGSATAAQSRGMAGVVERLARAFDTVPDAYFEALERRFEARLGVPLASPAE